MRKRHDFVNDPGWTDFNILAFEEEVITNYSCSIDDITGSWHNSSVSVPPSRLLSMYEEIGNLYELKTTQKDNLVNAINEVHSELDDKMPNNLPYKDAFSLSDIFIVYDGASTLPDKPATVAIKASTFLKFLYERLDVKYRAVDTTVPIDGGGTGATTPFQAARRLGRTSYTCKSTSNATLMEVDIANYTATYGCVLYLHVLNGNTSANASLRVNSVERPIYTCFGERLKGTEIVKNHHCEFTVAEANNGLPERWVLMNPKL